MTTFEYTYKTYLYKSIDEIIKNLNEMGNKGWELISHPELNSSSSIDSNKVFLFKRKQNKFAADNDVNIVCD